MKKEFKSAYDELLACLQYLDVEKGIENKMIAKKLEVSDSTISRLKIGASPEKTKRYLKAIKENFAVELLPFLQNTPLATNETIMQELRELKKTIPAEIAESKQMLKKIIDILEKSI